MAKAKGEIRLNTDTGFLKLLAIFFMAIDHAGKALFPQYAILRIIGRLAFPLFAYCLTVGCCYTHSMPKYILRVALLALLSQPIYAVALSHTTPAMNAATSAGAAKRLASSGGRSRPARPPGPGPTPPSPRRSAPPPRRSPFP